MIRATIITMFFICVIELLSAQRSIVAFYNVENLFDTINDLGVDDGDFTPQGKYKWDTPKYGIKINNIARVISEISPAVDILGLAEVENYKPIKDLIEHESLLVQEYDYVHYDSKDARGIDVAIIYNAITVKPLRAVSLSYIGVDTSHSREILHFLCILRGKRTHILVCHLPSVLSNIIYRKAAANSVKFYADSIAAGEESARIIVMGDFNSNPGNRVMKIIIPSLYNPFEPLYRKGYGSYMYRKRWNMYDAIVLSRNIKDVEATILIRDYLMQQDGNFKGYPFRSFSSNMYIGGYSDHLPIVASFE